LISEHSSKTLDDILAPDIVDGLKGSRSTKRKMIAYEHQQKAINKEVKEENKKQKQVVREEQKKQVKEEQVNYSATNFSSLNSPSVCTSKYTTSTPLPSFYHKKQYSRHYNPVGNGNCGYRALAHGLFDDEGRWMEVKKNMLLHLRKYSSFFISFLRQETTRQENGRYIGGTYNHLEELLMYHAASAADVEPWFTFPECAQFAADGFSVGISFFNIQSGENATFVPYHNHPQNTRPILLQLHCGHFTSLN
jgi:hypothetical protein